jgi:hypothetical protein
METHTYKELVSTFTSIPYKENTVWAETSKLCMMYIEFRNMDIIKHNLNNICNVYGGGDVSLAIVYSGDNEEIVKETTRGWTNVRYMKMYDNNVDVNEYSRLLTSYDFWDKFSEFEHVLTNSWDSYIFKRIPEKFFKYDIVGGPSAHFYVNYKGQIVNICADNCECPRCKEGEHPFKESNFITNPNKYFLFNGGFYLRKIDSIKKLCKEKPWSGEPDDVYFCISDLTRPSRQEAREFGVQDFKYNGIPVGCHQLWLKHDEVYVRKLFRTTDFGKIAGRFYLKQDLGLDDDDTPDLTTISELIETYPMWPQWIQGLPTKHKQLFTMFETSDVHPDVIKNMKLFDKVIVPYDYLKDVLVRHGVNCEALNWYTSPLIRHKPLVLEKKPSIDELIFLYVGTNDIRKNLIKLTRVFGKCLEGTKHRLIVKTNHLDNLTPSKNIKYVTERLSLDQMAGLYNMSDYVISFTHGEGVGLPMLEANYFKKPVICHNRGVLKTIETDSWIHLPCKEVEIDKNNVPSFLQKVFHGTWWEVNEDAATEIISNLCSPKMKIYYRLSDKGRRNGKPDFINLENCLRNFCEHFDSSDITIIADNCEDSTIDTIKKYIDENNIVRTSLGNSGAFLYAAKRALEENDDDTFVYLVEDDYLHVKNSENVIKEGFNCGDYVSLYDHPDKYLDGGWPNPYVFGGGEETKVFLTKSSHWKYTNSTTMTFAVRVKTLREDIELMEKYCKDKIPGDFQMFCELLNDKKRKLVTPIPGMSTHGQLPWFTPLVDWESRI